jgi:hypothetical protein
MGDFISDQDKRRIAEFARTPSYEREPDQLVPDDEDEE